MPQNTLQKFLTEKALLRLMVALLLLAFLQTIFFGFVYDDFKQITMNPWMESTAGLKAIFTHHSSAFESTLPARHYRPVFLAWLWMITHTLGGAPGFYHLAAVLTHLLAALLAFAVAKQLFSGDGRAAALVALLFALHPTKVESVAWISAAPESLNAVFLFASMYAYIRARTSVERRWLWTTASAATFAAAVMTKETAVILPALLLAWEWFFRAEQKQSDETNRSWKVAAQILAPLIAVLVAFLAIRNHLLHGVGDQAASESMLTTVYTAPIACWLWIRQMLFPVHMSTLYPVMIVRTPSFRLFVLPAITLLLVTAAYWRWARRNPLLKFAAAWMAITALPVIGEFSWVQLHDRHLYLPTFAAAIMVVVAARQVLEKTTNAEYRAAIACVALAAVFTAISVRETRVWDSQVTVFQRAVEVSPENTEAIDQLASSYIAIGEYSEGEHVLREGLQRVPDSARLSIALGLYLAHTDRSAEGAQYLRKALAMELPRVRRANVLYELSQIDWNAGQKDRAKAELGEAVKLCPEIGGYKLVLSRMYK